MTEQRILASSAGDGRRHGLLAGLGVPSAARCWSPRSAPRCAATCVTIAQHAAQHGLHPARGRDLQRGARAPARAPHQGRPRRWRRLRQPGDHAVGAVPRHGDDPPGAARAPAAAALPLRPRPRPRPRRPAGEHRRPEPLVPAAGLLLRHVRAGRAGAQRARPVRPDDVGAHRQQPPGRRDPGDLPPRLGSRGRGSRQDRRRSTPARRCSSAWARRWASWPSSRCWCPTCARRASPTDRASTSATPSCATPCRCGVWTVLFVVVTQTAYLVVVQLASGGAADGGDGTGYTVYSNSLPIMMVPHAIVTVSLATAILPRLSSYATDGRLDEVGSTVGSMRTRRSPGAALRGRAADRGRRRRRLRLRLGRRPRTRRPASRRRWRSSARRWSSSPSTTSCSAASTPWR